MGALPFFSVKNKTKTLRGGSHVQGGESNNGDLTDEMVSVAGV